jgi:hypothetical protein
MFKVSFKQGMHNRFNGVAFAFRRHGALFI